MSTPDKRPDQESANPLAGGVNAYKINRSGLVPPAQPGAPSHASQAPDGAAQAGAPASRNPRPRRAAALFVGGALVLGLGLLWLHRSPAPSRRLGEAGGAAVVRGDGARPATLPAYRALVIGINQYAQTEGEAWQTLNSARADAEAIAKTLAADYGFHVQTLLDGEATRAAILSALDDLATTGADGADLIYFAGHGLFDEKLQEGYWIPADARKSADGRQAKEDWLWNSTITRLISASHARHVLVMSDACYSGSLFRGDEPLGARTSQTWYERAIAKPSRYLITSGGIEPVLDSGAGHSVFAQQVINYLSHGDRTIFSANDLGLAIRERVNALTGQMVQMGPLPVSGHAGGEFVFVRQTSGEQPLTLSARPAEAADSGPSGAESAADPKARHLSLIHI